MTHSTAGVGAFLLGVAELSRLAGVLGLLESAAREREPVDAQLKARVESLVNRRQEARKQRDFAEADRLRNELTQLGVLMEDTPGGTTWKLR
jgi:cysteinyl-tRNA synthetase